MDRDLSAWVSQESVRASTSALSCSQASLFAGPSRPKTQHGFSKPSQRQTSQVESRKVKTKVGSKVH